VAADRVHLHNFGSSFADGVALAAIVAAVDPVEYSELVLLLAQPDSPERAASLSIEALAAAAGERLQVPTLVAADAVVGGTVDEKSMTIYMALLRRAIEANQAARVAAGPSAADLTQLAELEAALAAANKRAEAAERKAAESHVCGECDALRAALEATKVVLAESEAAVAEAQAAAHVAAEAQALERETAAAAAAAAASAAAAVAERLEEMLTDLASWRTRAEAGEAGSASSAEGVAAIQALLDAERAARAAAQAEAAAALDVERATRAEVERQLAEAVVHGMQMEDGWTADSAAQEAAKAQMVDQTQQLAKQLMVARGERQKSAAEAARLKQLVQQAVAQAKAAVVDGRAKVDSAMAGRADLDRQLATLRDSATVVNTIREQAAVMQDELTHYSQTAYWSGSCTAGYGVQMSGWLDKMSVEKSKDMRDETAQQMAKKQGKLAKNFARDFMDRTWKKRWFVLSGGCLYYFKGPNDVTADPKGVVFLHRARLHAAAFPTGMSKSGRGDRYVTPLGQGDDQLSIRVEGATVALNLKAANEDERIAWGVRLQKHIAFCEYCEQCWAEPEHPAPAAHLAQLLLDFAPGDGFGGQAKAESRLTAGHGATAQVVDLPPGTSLGATASATLLQELLLREAATLRTLRLVGVAVGGPAAVVLARAALPALEQLEELDLSQLALPTDDPAAPPAHVAAAIVGGLTEMATAVRGRGLDPPLRRLALARLPLGSCCKMLARLLPQLVGLAELDLSGCALHDKGAATAASGGLPPELVKLQLAENGLTAAVLGSHPAPQPVGDAARRAWRVPSSGGAKPKPPPPGAMPPPASTPAPPPGRNTPPSQPPLADASPPPEGPVVGPLTRAMLQLRGLVHLGLSNNAGIGDTGCAR
jgi:hypothetical protein